MIWWENFGGIYSLPTTLSYFVKWVGKQRTTRNILLLNIYRRRGTTQGQRSWKTTNKQPVFLQHYLLARVTNLSFHVISPRLLLTPRFYCRSKRTDLSGVFLVKYTKEHMPNESTLRKNYVDTKYNIQRSVSKTIIGWLVGWF